MCEGCWLVLGDRIVDTRSEWRVRASVLVLCCSDIAKQLYERVGEEKLPRGKPRDAVIPATVFIACCQAQVPRTFSEVCDLTRVSKKALAQCYKALERALLSRAQRVQIRRA